jgi:hypothetical protein
MKELEDENYTRKQSMKCPHTSVWYRHYEENCLIQILSGVSQFLDGFSTLVNNIVFYLLLCLRFRSHALLKYLLQILLPHAAKT